MLRRDLFRRLDGWLFALLLLVGAGALGFLGTQFSHTADWTAGARASLTPQSRAILRKLHGPVRIVSYANPQGSLRQTIADFIQRYQQVKPDLTLRFVDPEKDPARMRQLGITVNGELVVHYGKREQRLDELSEDSLTNALERLARGGDRLVAFVTGDGERLADGKANADLGTFMGQLEQSGLRAVPLNFSQVTAVPQGTDLVVLASPAQALPAGEMKALTDYLAEGGNLLWLTDPGNPVAQPLTHALGLRVLPGMLVDGAGAALGLKDPRMVAVGTYPPQTITHGFALATLFPEVSALAEANDSQWKIQPILRSSVQSWTELKPIDNTQPSTIRYDASSGDLKGPLDFGFALSRLSANPDKTQQRVVVIGDGDFLSNSFLGNGGNRALGERIFDWLLGDDVLVDLPPRGAPDRVLHLSQGGLDALSLGFIAGLPLLLLIVGSLIAWRRRRA
ncbi:GldG family protein [Dyella sp. A6]|uniref:GldG family protein n=1 Tax=Dyella aluminiiresistens TaxID=3069105 RepID=UPI002E79AC56|nr:GldG family protein [Dyella sp. A6]